MIKVVALIKGKPELSREQFLRYWQDEHPAYVRRLPSVRRYRQNPAIAHRKAWPFDGAAELWFDSVHDVAAAFASPAAESLREHERHFIGDLSWFLSEEHEVDLGEGAL